MEVTSILLKETAGQLKYVDVQGELVQTARALGVCFGDEIIKK